MTRIGLSLGIALVALVPLSAMAEGQHTAVQADSIKWAAGPPSLPKSAQIAVLFGDPAKEGAYGYRVKVPAGYTVPAHMHPTDENITVISGTFLPLDVAFEIARVRVSRRWRLILAFPRTAA